MIDAYYQARKDKHKQTRAYDRYIKLESLEDSNTRSDCISCQNIINNVFHDTERLTQTSADVFSFDEPLVMRIKSPFLPSGRSLRLYRVETPTPAYATPRTCDPQQVDIALLLKWIDRCQASHGSECLSSTIPPPSHNIYLIDTEAGCLVHKSADCRYIALSYVWGQVTRAHTTKSNLAALQNPGSITAEADQLAIPKTIRDALNLVSLLGERYLWVDSFCIIQDEEDTKELQLSSMASIYANAYLTIVAAAGKDADRGIPGICGGVEARKTNDGIFRLSSGEQVIAHEEDRFLAPQANTAWNSRGWTFQEGLFSRRILLFNESVSWICRSSAWEELIRNPTEDLADIVGLQRRPDNSQLAYRVPQWPYLYHWDFLVRQFNKRRLTFDGDVINAFSGAAAIFQRHFNGGLLWGIPEMFFDHCIIWEPLSALRRRRVYGDSSSVNKLPSWSWTGWEGDIFLAHFAKVVSSPECDDGHGELQPMVEWYKSKTSDAVASVRFPVKNIFYSNVSVHQHEEQEACSDGWIKKVYPEGNPYYINESAPSVRFCLPIPLSNHDIASMPDNESRFLFFKAQHAWLFMGQDVMTHPVWPVGIVKLYDREGNWAGSLRLHAHPSDRVPTGESCELIALSLAIIGADLDSAAFDYDDYDDGESREHYRDSKLYTFYKVMWIEWENGIAYRKAVGTVYKDMWDNQAPTTIDVVLG